MTTICKIASLSWNNKQTPFVDRTNSFFNWYSGKSQGNINLQNT